MGGLKCRGPVPLSCGLGFGTLHAQIQAVKGDALDKWLFLYLASILPLGILAQWLAWRFRLPSILLLLAFGFMLGKVFDIDRLLRSVVLGGEHPEVEFHPEQILFPFVSLSVAVILFEGGMTLRLSDLRQSGRGVLLLCTLGAAVSWGLTALAAAWLLGFSRPISILLGAILVVTGPTVIGPLLRHVRPSRRVGSVAKWEGIVIDPIGALLAVLVYTAVVHAGPASEALGQIVYALSMTLVVGAVLGILAGWVLVQLLHRFLIPDFLHNVVFLATVLAVFAISNAIVSESGLVTVTVMGIYATNQKKVSLQHVMQFKENLQVLLISSLFIVLASRIRLADLQHIGLRGLLFVAAMILVVRPLSVLLGTLGTELNWREKTFLAFLAPRGIVAAAVASIFALEVALAPSHGSDLPENVLADAAQLVPVTFLVIVVTVAVYGLAASPLARLLNLAAPSPQGILFAGADRWVIPVAKALHSEGFDVLLIDTNYDHTSAARMAGLRSVCASILSEYVQEELDLHGIGRLLALTPNDEVNALACQEMVHLFGRAQVYQVTPWDVDEGRRTSVTGHLRGRLLFGNGMTYAYLARRNNEGYLVKKTTLTEEFTFEDYRELYGTSAINLFVIKEKGELTIRTVDDNYKPAPGHKLISLVPPEKLAKG